MPSRAPWSTPPSRVSSGTTRAPDRTEAAAAGELDRAWAELASDPEFVRAGPLGRGGRRLPGRRPGTGRPTTSELEDPTTVRAIGVELGVEIEQDGMRLRGIIDRLDIGPDGALTVVDYKTGRAPSVRYEQTPDGRGPDLRPAVREAPRAGPGRGAPPPPARAPW